MAGRPFTDDDIFKHFAVGAKVRFESEMWEGKWEYGTVESHSPRGIYGAGLVIRSEDDELVAFDYRYLDIQDPPRNSMVKLVK